MTGPFLLLSLIGEALARAGGGHGYSSGSDGGGSSGGGGGSSGDAIGILLWLLLEHPVIGVPVIIIVLIVFVVQQRAKAGQGSRQVVRSTGRERERLDARPNRPMVPDLGWLRRADPTFSLPLFYDLARLVYVRAQEERGRNRLDDVGAFIAPPVRTVLRGRNAQATEVKDVILGSASLISAGQDGKAAGLTMLFEANYTEVSGGKSQQWLARERWLFARSLTAQSPGPEKMRELRCANCGNAAETRTDGTCRNCDTVIDDGRLQWHVVEVRVLEVKPLPSIILEPGGGMEEGTATPLVQAPDLAARLRELGARHPDFQWSAFRERAVDTFGRIQAAWGAGKYGDARPLETDFLYQQHRYWIERYAREGLSNKLANVRVLDVHPARVTVDPFVETITVRIFARMMDWTEDRAGKVVGGSRTDPRTFSEYWTFQRSSSPKAAQGSGLDACPSCGAPLDNVSAAGVCGYCESKIVTGDYDWVVSAIDQDEAYLG